MLSLLRPKQIRTAGPWYGTAGWLLHHCCCSSAWEPMYLCPSLQKPLLWHRKRPQTHRPSPKKECRLRRTLSRKRKQQKKKPAAPNWQKPIPPQQILKVQKAKTQRITAHSKAQEPWRKAALRLQRLKPLPTLAERKHRPPEMQLLPRE